MSIQHYTKEDQVKHNLAGRKYKTSTLFPRPDFWMGFGSILGIVVSYYRFRYSSTPDEADRKAIENDWGVISQDLLDVMERNPVDSLKSNDNLCLKKY